MRSLGWLIDEDENRRVLKGVRGLGGAHLDVDAMSDGTRDQLFLALRLAYIENYCEHTAVCPVILDDVLMAFDDERTSATLRALQELSCKTQVLVFTHHETAMDTAGKTLDEKELSDAMKETGLGTPATRAAIIEVLLKRGYIIRNIC